MENLITQLGIGAAVAVIILREVFSFLKERKEGTRSVCEGERRCVDELKVLLHDLDIKISRITEMCTSVEELMKEHKIRTENVPTLLAEIARVNERVSLNQEQIAKLLEKLNGNKLQKAGG